MTETNYFLATTPQHYKNARVFMKDDLDDNDHLSFPTIIAERDDEVIGVLSTRPTKNMIIAGPIRIDVKGNPTFTLIRLVDCYEFILRKAGITSYLMHTTDDYFIDTINKISDKWPIEPIASAPEGGLWFRRSM